MTGHMLCVQRSRLMKDRRVWEQEEAEVKRLLGFLD